MTYTDAFGLPLSTTSEAAAKAYCRGVECFLAYYSRAEVLAALSTAIELDENFALAHIAHARVLQVAAQIPQAREAAEKARQAAIKATPREQQHVEIQALLINGKPAQSYELLLTHVEEYPRDALAISVALGALGLFAFSGHNDSRESELAFLQRLQPAWEEHWWYDSYLGWALVETGAHAAGTVLLDRSLQAMPDNAQTVHARAHAYYETGQAEQGLSFIRAWLDEHDTSSVLYAHLRWHEALFAMQLGDSSSAHAIYREAIAPDVSLASPLLVLMDAASFAWRSVIYEQTLTPAELRDVADQACACLPKAGPAFFNWHKALALACARDTDGLTQLRQEIDSLITAGRQPPGCVMLQFCDGLLEMIAGNSQQATHLLQQAQERARSIGGSSAQQDVVVDSLIAALVRQGEQASALKRAQARSQQRAAHLNDRWVQRLHAA